MGMHTLCFRERLWLQLVHKAPLHLRVSSSAVVSRQGCGTFPCIESFGVQGAKHWRSQEGYDDEKVLSYQRNITNGGTRILQVSLVSNINISYFTTH